jgi:hypothetical protein
MPPIKPGFGTCKRGAPVRTFISQPHAQASVPMTSAYAALMRLDDPLQGWNLLGRARVAAADQVRWVMSPHRRPLPLESPGAEIFEGALQFGLGIHNDWPITCHRLTQRTARDQDKTRRAVYGACGH